MLIAQNFMSDQERWKTMKEYTNKEITIYWDPKKCIHSAKCVKGLPGVFDLKNRPWINMRGASSEEIMNVIDKCPSGALSYTKVCEKKEPTVQDQNPVAEIRVTERGPLMVKGECSLVNGKGNVLAKKGPFALCRCGGSKNMPYCDGTHRLIGFDDTTRGDGEQE
jgi:uncharacterized Fe-S cluster protein YjdI/CDGSH-type Zn-finger protein